MKAFHHSSTRVVGLAFLAGLWAAACVPSNNNASGSGGAKGGSSSSSSSSKTGGTTGTSSSQTGGNTKSSSGGTTGTSSSQTGGATSSSSGGTTDTSSSQTGGDTSTGTTTAVGGTGGGASSSASSSSGGSSGDSSSGGGSSGGTTSTDTGCPIVWDWEGTTTDSWTTDADVTLAVSTTQKVTGSQSLKVTLPAITSTGGDAATTTMKGFYITPPPTTSNMWPGATITVHVWVPAGTTGPWMQLFTQSNNWSSWNSSTGVTPTAGAWTTLTFTVPAATAVFPSGINQFGMQFGVSGGGTFAGGDIYIDSITVCGGTQACSCTATGSFDFETAGSTDTWAFKGATTVTDTVVTQSTAEHYGTTGTGSLKVAMTAIPVAPAPPATGWTSRLVELGNPKAYCGQTVTYHVMAD